VEDAIQFFENLLDGDIWKRVGLVVLGGILIIFALTKFSLSDRAFQIGRSIL
jgi:hypothetical protein